MTLVVLTIKLLNFTLPHLVRAESELSELSARTARNYSIFPPGGVCVRTGLGVRVRIRVRELGLEVNKDRQGYLCLG